MVNVFTATSKYPVLLPSYKWVLGGPHCDISDMSQSVCAVRNKSPESQGDQIIPAAVFSTLIGRGPPMFCSDWLDLTQNVAPPALLSHKEPAQDTQSPPLLL